MVGRREVFAGICGSHFAQLVDVCGCCVDYCSFDADNGGRISFEGGYGESGGEFEEDVDTVPTGLSLPIT